MLINRPRGTSDILPGAVEMWQYVEQTVRAEFDMYNYHEIRTPVFEHTELFQRGVGETTDIVSKEMYSFTDRGDRSITLRPEGTAGVVRAFVENKLYGSVNQPVKLYYIGPMFRYERPQAGRGRQFYQCGVEVIGSDHPSIDAEVMVLGVTLLRKLGIDGFRLELGSVGCGVCRASHRAAFIAKIAPVKEQLCADCQSRFERNPMRILDCKNETCRALTKDAPTVLEHLCDACEEHFDGVKSYLDQLDTPYVVNPRLVRGLDYYTRTAFEIVEPGIGANSTVIAGGRYNGLVANLGGPDAPGIGFGVGIERLLLSIEHSGAAQPQEKTLDVYVAAVGDEADRCGAKLLQQLRQAGYRADKDYTGRSFKTQLKAADRLGARSVIVIGEDEIARGVVQVRDMQSGEQVEISGDKTMDYIKKTRQSAGSER